MGASGFTIADINVGSYTTSAAQVDIATSARSGTLAAARTGFRVFVLWARVIKGSASQHMSLAVGSKSLADSGWDTGGAVAPAGWFEVQNVLSATGEALTYAASNGTGTAAYVVTWTYIPDTF